MGSSSSVAVGVWAVAEALGVAREAEALVAEWYEEYGEEAMGMLEAWVLEHGGAELLERATAGAEVCVAHWAGLAEAGDEEGTELVGDARARVARLADGTATSVDILGALDWLE